MNDKYTNRPQEQLNPQGAPAEAQGPSQEPIRVDGFAQVLAMLKIADPEFRESLLRRLAQRDRELARTLRADLANLGL